MFYFLKELRLCFDRRWIFLFCLASLVFFSFTFKMSPRGQPRPEESDMIANSLHMKSVSKRSPDPCGGLLFQGHFEYCNKTEDLNEGIKRCWKPQGCNLHIYSTSDFHQCLKNVYDVDKEIVMMGDSRMADIYFSLVSLSFGEDTFNEKYMKGVANYHQSTNTTFRFIWTPSFKERAIKTLKQVRAIPFKVLVFVIGITLHHISAHDSPKKNLANFKSYLRKAKNTLDAIGKEAIVMWMLEPPVKEEHAKELGKKALNYQVDLYNEAARKILTGGSLRVWYSAKRIGEDSLDFYKDDIHLGNFANANIGQIVLNTFCNTRMNFPKETCCV